MPDKPTRSSVFYPAFLLPQDFWRIKCFNPEKVQVRSPYAAHILFDALDVLSVREQHIKIRRTLFLEAHLVLDLA